MRKLLALLLLLTAVSAWGTSGHSFFTHFTRIHFPAEMSQYKKNIVSVNAIVAVKMVQRYDRSLVYYTDEQVIRLTDMGDHFFGKAIQHGSRHVHSHDIYVGPVVRYQVTFEDGTSTEVGPYPIKATLEEGKNMQVMGQELESAKDASSTFSRYHYYGYAS